MLAYLTLIMACQLAGEFTARAAALPVPGPVVGMVLLFCFLLFRGSVHDDLATVGDNLLRHLSLLFVPAGVGVMLHFQLLGDDWLPIAAALLVSTTLTIAVTAWIMDRLGRNTDQVDGSTTADKS